MVSDDSRTYNDPRDSRQRAREQARAKAARDKQEWRQQAEQSNWQRRQRGAQQLQNQPWRSKFADLPQSHDQLQERKQVYRQQATGQFNTQRQQSRQRQYTDEQRRQAELIYEQERRARQQVQQRAEQQRAQERAVRQQALQDQHEAQRLVQEQRARQERRHLQLQGTQTNQQVARQRAEQQREAQMRAAQQQTAQQQAAQQQTAQQREAQMRAEQKTAQAYAQQPQAVQPTQVAQPVQARSAQQQTVQQREAQMRAEQRAAAQRAAEQVQLQNARAGQALENGFDDYAEYDSYVEYPDYGQDAAQYSRDMYSAGVDNTVSPEDFYEPAPAQNAYQRESGRYTSRYGTNDDDGRQIPKKLIAIIAAVLIVLVILFALNPFGCGSQASGSSKASSSSSTATKTATSTKPALPTPIMCESGGITLHSAVAMIDLTEILIHNASYGYANEITTKLAEATNTEIIAAHGTGRDAASQPTGNQWMTGEFIRCFRSGNGGPVMSAIDCGGPVGATVYAPVSGTVMLVKEYDLYNEIEDYRVHIQPEGRPDLDVVLIHLTDVSVKPGQKVTGGETSIGKIRDVEQYLGDSMQLKQYTAASDRGNHTHIQVNNANDPEYHGLDDLKPAAANTGAGDAQIAS